jgi:deoxynucleoside triphosphate triphosphohydrolase SAMHD1
MNIVKEYTPDYGNQFNKDYKIIFDPIYGEIEINKKDLKFIDNKWVKRLKRIKQLGILDHIFPSASHNRLEHSIGVYHKSKIYIENLKKNSKYNIFDNKIIRNIQLGGLFHDLGHGPFSHVFDNIVLKNICPNHIYANHENRSKLIVDKIYQELKNQSDSISQNDLEMIKEIIEPENINNYGHPVFSIINNKINSIDVDKLDYMSRDPYHIGIDTKYSIDRIMSKSYIAKNKGNLSPRIIYSKGLEKTIFDLFYTRYRLHKDIYNHKTSKIIELMLGDALIEAQDVFDWKDIISNEEFLKIDDSIYNFILFSENEELQKSKNLIERIENRDLYTLIWCGDTNNRTFKEILEEELSDYKESELRSFEIKVNFCNGSKSPFENIEFEYGKCNMLPIMKFNNFEESETLIYSIK